MTETQKLGFKQKLGECSPRYNSWLTMPVAAAKADGFTLSATRLLATARLLVRVMEAENQRKTLDLGRFWSASEVDAYAK